MCSQSNKKATRNVAQKPRLSYQDVYSSSEDESYLEKSSESPQILQKPNPADIRNGTYLLTELLVKQNSKKYWYVAVADSSVEDNDVNVTFLRNLIILVKSLFIVKVTMLSLRLIRLYQFIISN